jgi:Zinc carboxypeptidase
MNVRAASRLAASAAGLMVALALGLTAAGSVSSPDQFIGFKVGADNKLARWDKIVDYMKAVAAGSDRVRLRELGKTNQNNPFLLLEISSPETLRNLERFKQLQRKLYFQNGGPTARERDEIFRQGKAVVLITCSVHATEIGATQMALELVHQLATDDSPAVKKILDNVIVLLVPSLNPDGQVMVTDWFNMNLGTPYETSPLPRLYHPYAGHDNNRDMYMLTQRESQYMAQVAWHDWFPAVWLDEHEMNNNGPRIFVMPATDPINPNVHPLIYRWNTILGQSQAAALEAAGKQGIIYNSTYTNFWQGAMAWSGWWHNQIGLLTEVASVRVAAPVDQQRALPRVPVSPAPPFAGPLLPPPPPPPRDTAEAAPISGAPIAAPTDIVPRTEYPRPWMGGRWTLADIVDYELIATMALLDTAADRREAILRQVYEVNRQTIEEGRTGTVKAIVIPVERQHDPREAAHLADRLALGGIEVYRADAPFSIEGDAYAAGTFVIPMTQVFARYAKDMLEKQTYPEVRRTAAAPPDAPYDVTAWSLGMLLGVDVQFVEATLPAGLKTTRVRGLNLPPGRVSGNGPRFAFTYRGADTAIAINRLLKDGARLWFSGPSQVAVENVPRPTLEELAREFSLAVTTAGSTPADADATRIPIRTPRVAVYAPWTAGNIDEGWTRWVLEQYEFPYTTIHNMDIRAGGLRRLFDAIVIPDQAPRDIIDGYTNATVRPEYRGGIGEAGVEALSRFVSEGGTLITLGAASDLAIDRLPLPVRDLKRSLRRDQHFAPGTILRIQVDTSHPIGFGMQAETFGFYNNSPFFTLLESFNSQRPTIVARYPNQEVVGSGWLRGEEQMAGRAAVVSIDLNPGRVVLFGLRPQHRGQTHATFPMLFNALYLSAGTGPLTTTNQ